MYRFNLIRGSRDLVGHMILIAFPVILIAFFDYIYRQAPAYTGLEGTSYSYLTVLAIGFALTFQIYGAGLSFENIAVDFFSPIRYRIQATPCDPRRLIMAILISGMIVGFLQSLVVLLFATLFLGAMIPLFPFILPIMAISIIFHHLLGSVIMVLSGSVKTANVILSIYGGVAPMFAGLYFPLPDTPLFHFLRKYLTPMALGNTASLGILGKDISLTLSGLIPLIVLTGGVLLLLRQSIKKVTT